jgi:hypothetical protein
VFQARSYYQATILLDEYPWNDGRILDTSIVD